MMLKLQWVRQRVQMGKWRCTHSNDLVLSGPLTKCCDTQLAPQVIKDTLHLCMENLYNVCNAYNHNMLSHRFEANGGSSSYMGKNKKQNVIQFLLCFNVKALSRNANESVRPPYL